MNNQKLLYRKIGYFCAIALLLIPLAMLSQPQSKTSDGGKLANLRQEYHLSQAEIGEIDPTSETIKLATFGLRGVAAMILWSKASHYKTVKDWTSFDATLEQITKVMPNSIGVWRYQAWNVSYNISSEFDDYRQRYIWIIKGVDFLKKGVERNKHEARLQYDLGWFMTHKIGRADEKEEFRRMYRDEFGRDNWKVGKDYYLQSQYMVDREQATIKGITPIIFHSRPGMAQIYYADALIEDGVNSNVLANRAGIWKSSASVRSPLIMKENKNNFISNCKQAWSDAYRDWHTGDHSLGKRDLFAKQGMYVRLADLDVRKNEIISLLTELDRLEPGINEKILSLSNVRWPDKLRKALKTAAKDRTTEQKKIFDDMLLELVDQLDGPYLGVLKLAVNEEGSAKEVDNKETRKLEKFKKLVQHKNKPQVRKILYKLSIARFRRYQTLQVQNQLNYEYWKVHSQTQIEQSALLANYWVDRAKTASSGGRLSVAKRCFDKAFLEFKKLFDKYPILLENRRINEYTSSEMYEIILEYRTLLVRKMDMKFPIDFTFNKIIVENDTDGLFEITKIENEKKRKKDLENKRTSKLKPKAPEPPDEKIEVKVKVKAKAPEPPTEKKQIETKTKTT